MVNEIIDEAYKLYMPQVRSEIEGLTNFLLEHFKTNGRGEHCSIPRQPLLNVLEIGTKFGGTFYIWNSINAILRDRLHPDIYSPSERNKICISIDMNDGGQHGGISEEEMDKRDLWFYERFENCHFIRGDSHDDETFEKVHNLLGYKYFTPKPILFKEEPKIDFLFIDGDHSYEGVKQDFLDYSPLVKSGGLVCFHDITISEHHHSRNVCVGEFWNELKESGKYQTLEFVDGNENWGGIGVICLK